MPLIALMYSSIAVFAGPRAVAADWSSDAFCASIFWVAVIVAPDASISDPEKTDELFRRFDRGVADVVGQTLSRRVRFRVEVVERLVPSELVVGRAGERLGLLVERGGLLLERFDRIFQRGSCSRPSPCRARR